MKKISRLYLRINNYFHTQIKAVLMCSLMLILTGCAMMPSASQTASTENDEKMAVVERLPPQGPAPVASTSKVEQCNNELAALQKINSRTFSHHRLAMDKLIESGRKYQSVQNGLSQEINDVMQPRFQFILAELCWRIRNDLTASLLQNLNRANTHKG